MTILISDGFKDDNECFSQIVDHVRNVKKLRSLGMLLKIESGKLDLFERDPANFARRVIREWFSQTPMTVPERWEELGRVLLEPALEERKLAMELHPRVRRGSSIDSAISEMSGTSRSSITSSTEVPPQYLISNIGANRYWFTFFSATMLVPFY